MSMCEFEPAPASGEAALPLAPCAYVIDDDEAIREALLLELSTSGYRCAAFRSGPDFLRCADRLEPGCIILDLRMPGKNGIEMLAELAQRGIRWPTIMVTAHGEAVTAADAIRLGAVQFLEKPFSGDTLLCALAQETEKLKRKLPRMRTASRLEPPFPPASAPPPGHICL
jgi:two-component system response regulator FixJ